ncbi:MAG: cystathionine beta-lyase [Rhodospirillaceae bacterium]|nr:cystathionine beta-lyase [Rhodospirillaceae bacterium]
MKEDTKIIHGGGKNALKHGVVNTPVYRASTVIFSDTDQMQAAAEGAIVQQKKVHFYGRKGSPTSWALEEALTDLEQGYDTVLAPSGLGAVTTALLSFLKAGDHLLMVDTVYEPTRRFCDVTLARFGVEVTYYDPLIGGGIAALMCSNTTVVFTESPGSHTFEMQDLPAISDAAHAINQDVVVMIDNTWASPLFHKPLTLGADISIQACTKYVVGHSDVMLGSITALEKHFPALYSGRQELGVAASPDDVYLATRGLRTLGVRLREHEKNTIEIAKWFQARSEVDRVLYPALPEDPGHEIWKRDFTGASGLFGVIFKETSNDAVFAMINGMKYFALGFSWGGYESLISHSSPAKSRTATTWPHPGPGIRLHIGLEDPDDLIADLEEGLSRFNAALTVG